MEQTVILNLILIISVASLCCLIYHFRRKIISFSTRIYEGTSQHLSECAISNKNIFCVFLGWTKFLHFCVWYIFMLLGTIILFWMTIKNPILTDFLKNYSLEVSIKTLYEPSVIQNYFAGNFPAFVLLVGVFASYCYFFDYIRSVGLKLNKFSKEKPSWFIYLFFICVFISIVIIGCALEGYLGTLDSNKVLEIITLASVLFVTVLNARFFMLIYPKGPIIYTKFEHLSFFLRKESFEVFFSSFSIVMFFITLEMVIFGYIFGFNPLSIVSLDVILIFLLWVLGILNQHPLNRSNIQLKRGGSISQVYILEIDEKFVHYLSSDDKIEKITIDSAFKIENSACSPTESSQHDEECLINEKSICTCISKISESIIIFAGLVSIAIGILFYLLYAILQFLQPNEIFYLVILMISTIIFGILAFLIILLYFTYKEISI